MWNFLPGGNQPWLVTQLNSQFGVLWFDKWCPPITSLRHMQVSIKRVAHWTRSLSNLSICYVYAICIILCRNAILHRSTAARAVGRNSGPCALSLLWGLLKITFSGTEFTTNATNLMHFCHVEKPHPHVVPNGFLLLNTKCNFLLPNHFGYPWFLLYGQTFLKLCSTEKINSYRFVYVKHR